jgi:hypothetical protein
LPAKGLLFLGAFAALAAAQDDPTDVLLRLREQVTAHGQRIPNHTCVETIQRDRFQPTHHAPTSCDALLARRQQSGAGAFLKADIMDRLRLDVALAEDREIYSWAGASRFEEGDIDELIPEGPIGTGPFAAMLLSIFAPRNPRFFYDGDTSLAGQRLMQFSFTMPREESEYRVKAGTDWLITGYSGTLLVEPRTATLVRLTVRTDELPPATTACEVDSTLDYTTVQLGGLGYLLPKSAHQRFISRNGSEAENAISFASCREYQAEATLSFGGGVQEKAGHEAKPETDGWPVGLPVTVELAADIALDQAAAGDRIEGRLASPIVDFLKRTLAPVGAVLSGRLMRVETRYSSPPEITIAVRWETIEFNGVKAPIALSPVRNASGGIVLNTPIGSRVLRRRGAEIDLPLPGEGRYAIFRFTGDHPVMKSGLRSDWMTVMP